MGKRIVLAVPNLTNGGTQRAVSVWADELHTRGYDVSIVLFYRSGSEYNVNPDIPIYALAGGKAEYKSMRPLKKTSVSAVF